MPLYVEYYRPQTMIIIRCDHTAWIEPRSPSRHKEPVPFSEVSNQTAMLMACVRFG